MEKQHMHVIFCLKNVWKVIFWETKVSIDDINVDFMKQILRMLTGWNWLRERSRCVPGNGVEYRKLTASV
jgi:hypothetical protein